MHRVNFTFFAISVFTIVVFAALNVYARNEEIWSQINATSLRQSVVERRETPDRFAAFSLDKNRLRQMLDRAPEEFSDGADMILSLPMPDGTLARFSIEHSLIVEPGLLKKFPELGATYRGQGIDDPTATVRFDLLPSGFHAMILRAGTTVFIDPQGDSYIAYEKTALTPPKDPFICHVNDRHISDELITKQFDIFGSSAVATDVISGSTLRTYRLALAATREYTAFYGGTLAGAAGGQVVTMNRVNAIYERELGIRLNIIANNNLIIWTAEPDPYTNNNGSSLLAQNQSVLDAVIGSANYDIGHVFSTAGGGVASPSSTCNGPTKARGTTGIATPVGDAFDITYVAHEMAHQFGAGHTFNGTSGSCGGGNRIAGSANEPGSGISIMSFAGFCLIEDLAPQSIDSFVVKSLEQIIAFREGAGSCGAQTPTGNAPPTVTGPANFTIPIQTPFSLTASATDVNGDALTYDWQEYYTTSPTAAPPNTDGDGQARPIFRKYQPAISGTRYFPSLNYILSSSNIPPSTYDCGRATPCLTGEIMSSMNRTMNFQVVVRDNLGGINTATSQVTVSSLAGPFGVTAPNTAVNFTAGTTQTVTWSVANSNLAPVNAANVDILLSTDGGMTYSMVLAANTPNDGSQAVTIPNTATTTARILVRARLNIFFDVSDTNFTITASSFTVSGRVFGLGDRGVRGARVTLTPLTGPPITVFTNSFGQYSVSNVPGGSYTITAAGRRFTYAPQPTTIGNDLVGIDFRPI